MKQTFEQFLEERYEKINSNSNNMNPEFENARDAWFESLDVQDLIDYGEIYGKLRFIEGKQAVLEQFKKLNNLC